MGLQQAVTKLFVLIYSNEKMPLRKRGHFLWAISKAMGGGREHCFQWFWMILFPPIMYAAYWMRLLTDWRWSLWALFAPKPRKRVDLATILAIC
jgi:hypothetical protein